MGTCLRSNSSGVSGAALTLLAAAALERNGDTMADRMERPVVVPEVNSFRGPGNFQYSMPSLVWGSDVETGMVSEAAFVSH